MTFSCKYPSMLPTVYIVENCCPPLTVKGMPGSPHMRINKGCQAVRWPQRRALKEALWDFHPDGCCKAWIRMRRKRRRRREQKVERKKQFPVCSEKASLRAPYHSLMSCLIREPATWKHLQFSSITDNFTYGYFSINLISVLWLPHCLSSPVILTARCWVYPPLCLWPAKWKTGHMLWWL